jgi:hypothetical protein
MAVNPKTFHAVKSFSCAGRNFQAGDEVADPVVLRVVLDYGEQFVSADTKRTRKAASTETEGAS